MITPFAWVGLDSGGELGSLACLCLRHGSWGRRHKCSNESQLIAAPLTTSSRSVLAAAAIDAPAAACVLGGPAHAAPITGELP